MNHKTISIILFIVSLVEGSMRRSVLPKARLLESRGLSYKPHPYTSYVSSVTTNNIIFKNHPSTRDMLNSAAATKLMTGLCSTDENGSAGRRQRVSNTGADNGTDDKTVINQLTLWGSAVGSMMAAGSIGSVGWVGLLAAGVCGGGITRTACCHALKSARVTPAVEQPDQPSVAAPAIEVYLRIQTTTDAPENTTKDQ